MKKESKNQLYSLYLFSLSHIFSLYDVVWCTYSHVSRFFFFSRYGSESQEIKAKNYLLLEEWKQRKVFNNFSIILSLFVYGSIMIQTDRNTHERKKKNRLGMRFLLFIWHLKPFGLHFGRQTHQTLLAWIIDSLS